MDDGEKNPFWYPTHDTLPTLQGPRAVGSGGKGAIAPTDFSGIYAKLSPWINDFPPPGFSDLPEALQEYHGQLLESILISNPCNMYHIFDRSTFEFHEFPGKIMKYKSFFTPEDYWT